METKLPVLSITTEMSNMLAIKNPGLYFISIKKENGAVMLTSKIVKL